MLVNMKGSLLGLGLTAIILILSSAVIIYATIQKPYEDYVATREGELASFGNFNNFFLKTFNQSVGFISQRVAFELAKNGGFNEGEEVFWNFYYPQISDLKLKLERAIERGLPSYYKKLNRTVRLSGAEINVGEQNQYFDVTGGANFSIIDDSIRAQTFSYQPINSRVYSSYFRLLKAAREILENETFNSSLGDATALLDLLRKETILPSQRFYGLDFGITVSGDVLDVTIKDICYPPNTYCLAPLYSDEPKVLKSGSDWIPYDYVKLNFKIKAKQTGATPPTCDYLLDLNPKIGSMTSDDQMNPGPTITVTNTGTTNDIVGLTARVYDSTGNLVNPSAGIDVSFASSSGPMSYSTSMIITTTNTPADVYTINVTADGCSPNVERFVIYNLTVNPSMTFSIKVIPNYVKLNRSPGYNNITNVIVNITSGTAKPVKLYFDSLPAGISWIFSQNDIPPDFVSVLNLTTDGTTPAMVYPLTIKGYGGGSYNQTTFNLAVEEPFDFDIFATPNNADIFGSTGFSPIITVKNKTTGTPENVQITYKIISNAKGPSADNYNITIAPSSTSCMPNPTCNPPMSISTTRYTPADDYTIYINGSTTYVWKQISFDLKIKTPECLDMGVIPSTDCETFKGGPPTSSCKYWECVNFECQEKPYPADYDPAGQCGTESCGDKCDGGKEYRNPTSSTYNRVCDGLGNCNMTFDINKCNYGTIKDCSYDCKNSTHCYAGIYCEKATAICQECGGPTHCSNCDFDVGVSGCCGIWPLRGCNCVAGDRCYSEDGGPDPAPDVLCDVKCDCLGFWSVSKVVTDCSACDFLGKEDSCGPENNGCEPDYDSGCQLSLCYQTDSCTYICYDTDGGNVLTTKGTCTDEDGSYLDVCTDATHVSEYICFADLCVSSVATLCPPATPNCVGGACVT